MIPHVHGSGCSRWVQLCVSARAISYYHKDRVSCHRTFTGNQTKNIFRINKTRNDQKNVHSYLKIFFFLHFSGDHDLFSFCQIPVKQLELICQSFKNWYSFHWRKQILWIQYCHKADLPMDWDRNAPCSPANVKTLLIIFKMQIVLSKSMERGQYFYTLIHQSFQAATEKPEPRQEALRPAYCWRPKQCASVVAAEIITRHGVLRAFMLI